MSEQLPEVVYANFVEMSLSPFDLIMDFGFKSPEDVKQERDDPDSPRHQVATRIAMSHAHAKSMLPLLARMIADFEKQVGTIPAPGFDDRSKD